MTLDQKEARKWAIAIMATCVVTVAASAYLRHVDGRMTMERVTAATKAHEDALLAEARTDSLQLITVSGNREYLIRVERKLDFILSSMGVDPKIIAAQEGDK